VDSGAIVANVESGGPADDAGLRAKDVITSLDSTEIKDSGDLLSALRGYQPGDNITLTVDRNGDERDIDVKLGERSQ
jgi:S1-C subfamily serine protease